MIRNEDQILWEASEELQNIPWDSRNIITYKGTGLTTFDGTDAGMAFVWDNLTDDQKPAWDLISCPVPMRKHGP